MASTRGCVDGSECPLEPSRPRRARGVSSVGTWRPGAHPQPASATHGGEVAQPSPLTLRAQLVTPWWQDARTGHPRDRGVHAAQVRSHLRSAHAERRPRHRRERGHRASGRARRPAHAVPLQRTAFTVDVPERLLHPACRVRRVEQEPATWTHAGPHHHRRGCLRGRPHIHRGEHPRAATAHDVGRAHHEQHPTRDARAPVSVVRHECQSGGGRLIRPVHPRRGGARHA